MPGREWLILEWSRNELKILWHLKRHGPLIARSINQKDSILVKMAADLDMRKATLGYILKRLEDQSLVLRSYNRPKSAFKDNQGYNPLTKLELIDPNMYLPPLPAPLPLAAIVEKENDDLYERTAEEPTAEAIMEALLNRITQLQSQVNKLQDIVEEQSKIINRQRDQRPRGQHLTNRIKDALTPEQWENISHKGRR